VLHKTIKYYHMNNREGTEIEPLYEEGQPEYLTQMAVFLRGKKHG
jgi:hypothetical protein